MLPILPINSNNTTLPIPGTDRDDLLKFQQQMSSLAHESVE